MPELNGSAYERVSSGPRVSVPSIQRSVLFRHKFDEMVTELAKTSGATRSRIYNAALIGFFQILTEDQRKQAMAVNMAMEAKRDQ